MKAFTPENAAWFTPTQIQNTYKFTVTDVISFITKTATLPPPSFLTHIVWVEAAKRRKHNNSIDPKGFKYNKI